MARHIGLKEVEEVPVEKPKKRNGKNGSDEDSEK